MSSSGDGDYTGSSIVSDAEGTSPTEAVGRLISAPILAAAGGIAYLIGSAFESLADIGKVFDAAWGFLVALLTEPITILEITSEATGVSIADNFAIFAFPIGVGMVVIGFIIWERSGIGLPIVDTLWRR